jgi:MurNAc alpha-1-phosphate uridylyltransferase
MVFAAGLGKRMLPLTERTPKPLIKISDKPIIEYSLDKLAQAGIRNVVVNTHHLPLEMEQYLRHYAKLRLKITHEPTLLETGGGLVNALPLLGDKEPFFVINGDVICLDGESGNFFARLAKHWRPDMNALLLMKRVDDPDTLGYDGRGDFDISYNQQLVKKPAEHYQLVYTGIQIFHPRLLKGMQAEPFSLSWIYSKAIQEDGTLKGIFGLVHDGPWLHIGTPDAVTHANEFFKKNNRQNPTAGW